VHQLSGLDAAFLAMETSPSTATSAASACSTRRRRPEPLTLERLQSVIGRGCTSCRRSAGASRRCRSASTSRTGSRTRTSTSSSTSASSPCRRPATTASSPDQAARLHARPLDRRRPLWELYLISGLSGGRVAIYTKVHHAAIDGVSGNDILAAVLDLSPEGRDLGEVPEWHCDEVPGPIPLLARSLVTLAWQPVRAVRVGASVVASLPGLARTTSLAHSPGPRPPAPPPGQQRGARAVRAARAAHAVQPAAVAAPPLGLPHDPARGRQGGQARCRGDRQRRRHDADRRRAAPVAARPRRAARRAAHRRGAGVDPQ
jgi:hypothetical protein